MKQNTYNVANEAKGGCGDMAAYKGCVISGLSGEVTRDQLARAVLAFAPEAEAVTVTINNKVHDMTCIDLWFYKHGGTKTSREGFTISPEDRINLVWV